MRHAFGFVLCLVLGGNAVAQDDDRVIIDPTAPHRVDYLVVAGDDAFVEPLRPLLRFRAKNGLRSALVTMETVRAHFTDLRAFLRHAVTTWSDPAPRFLLLVGDCDTVPAVVRAGEFTVPPGERNLATDFEYACPVRPLQPRLHVGRFPCDTAAECATMVQRVFAYDRAAGGAWQHKVAFVTGEAGFSPQLDRMIEQLFIRIVAPGIPDPFDIELAYANPRSPFCPDPARFNAHSLSLLNAGSLFYVYVGHGYRNGVDRLRFNRRIYRVLDAPDAPKIDVRQGRPVMVVIACSTGQYDHPQDCVGEVFYKQAGGPIAFIGGSRVTQPYFNGLFGKALVDNVFGAETLGEAFTAAKRQVLKHAKSQLTQQADFMAGMMQGGPRALPGMRRDGVRHYNLFGDPALRLRRPADDLAITVKGNTITVRGPAKRVRLTLEVPRGRHAHALPEVDLTADDAGDQLAARYKIANDPVLQAWELELTDGVARVTFTRPAKPGTYTVKAHALGHVGATRFTIEPPIDDDF